MVKKRAKFKVEIIFDRLESFLYCLGSNGRSFENKVSLVVNIPRSGVRRISPGLVETACCYREAGAPLAPSQVLILLPVLQYTETIVCFPFS